MLVSCRYCNRFHNRGEICENRPKDKRKKEPTYVSRFRSSQLWKNKSYEIKTRDKFLCQTCLRDGKYTFQKLEVHHIMSISKNWNERLNNSNLITLCNLCHKQAELGNIRKNILFEIITPIES